MSDKHDDAPDDDNTEAPGEETASGETPVFTLVPPGDIPDEPPETPAEDDDSETGDEASAPSDDDGEDGGDGEEDDGEGEGEEESEDEDEGEGDGDGISPLPVASIVEAVLFAAREPLKLAQIARAVGKRTRQDVVRAAIDELNVAYLETARAFEIAEISGRFQLMSRPEYAEHIMRIYPKRELTDKETKSQRLTPAMLDTLAIIAYKQPVMRSEIEHIRGVACGPVLRTLIERGSVQEIGRRSDLVGKPAVFGTTERFLAEFGLGSIEELPLRNEFVTPGESPQVEMAVVEPVDDDPAAPQSEEEIPGEETDAGLSDAEPEDDEADSEEDEFSDEESDEDSDDEDSDDEEYADEDVDDEDDEDDDGGEDDFDDEDDEEEEDADEDSPDSGE